MGKIWKYISPPREPCHFTDFLGGDLLKSDWPKIDQSKLGVKTANFALLTFFPHKNAIFYHI